MPEMINVLPSRFADECTSGLTAEVTAEGPNEFLIQLSSEPPPAADYEDLSGIPRHFKTPG
jgi:hypothetical protein